MTILIIGISIMLFFGLLHYRRKWLNLVIHHRNACVLHQKQLLSIMSEQIGAYFKDSLATNYIVRLNNGKIEILIGDDELLIPVDTDDLHADSKIALDNAYNKFMAHVR